MRALILTGKGAQCQELVYPFYRLQEAGFGVDVAAPGKERFATFRGIEFKPSHGLWPLAVKDWGLLVIPGGVKCMEHLRLEVRAVQFVADFHAAGGVVASICSGAQMLISAGLCRGRRISCYPAMQIDVENAGAEFHPGPAVVDDRIVTAPHYRDLGAWMKLTFQTLARQVNDA